ncbi:long-chain-fatty-acid--CoA ligase [Chromatocurvus halotolerans]|uniref:Long-chain acyl-CoA synthetase n=1 Tax=Chromatocurvus halotolerans TaxID=1132028 RepID=A0A4V2SC94_9GAMM|nr:long-chain-fatty-acid--CoA ligase [Chromatocurvus halotolerans]TCO78490.1 long-chain acyl-CoA synthetase [Chromatocurvus halotolerans]
MFSLTSLARRAAQINPDAIAVTAPGHRVHWREFPERIARLAGGLRNLGVRPDDSVAILALNSAHYYEFYFAVAWSGGVFVPVNTRLAPPEILHWLSDSDTRVVCVDATFLPVLQAIAPQLPDLAHIVLIGDASGASRTPVDGELPDWDSLAQTRPVPDADRRNDDIAGIFYTGGTTGRSKGVMLSQQNLVVNAMQAAPILELQPGDRCLHAAPMFHIADWCMCVGMALMGGSNSFLPAFEPGAVMQRIQDEGIEKMLMVPTMINMIVNHPHIGDFNLSSLKAIMYGASPMPEAVIRRALEVLPGTRFYQAYGQTEAAPILTMLRPEYHTTVGDGPFAGRLKSAGHALPGVELTVLDADDQPVPNGEVGEVCARGPNVMLGYRNLPGQTADTLAGGWLHTGDGGRLDDDGFLFIVDRVKDMIVTGGENVYSAEVENAIFQHEDVEQCAVIGVPDEKWGERVHAIVVPKAGRTPEAEAIVAHCRQLIAGFKCPRSVELRSEPLPLSGAGKILKTELRKPYWDQQKRNVS